LCENQKSVQSVSSVNRIIVSKEFTRRFLILDESLDWSECDFLSNAFHVISSCTDDFLFLVKKKKLPVFFEPFLTYTFLNSVFPISLFFCFQLYLR